MSCEYFFGDKLLYSSPDIQGLRTRCVFVRRDGDYAIVIFKHADRVARVSYELIEFERKVFETEEEREIIQTTDESDEE